MIIQHPFALFFLLLLSKSRASEGGTSCSTGCTKGQLDQTIEFIPDFHHVCVNPQRLRAMKTCLCENGTSQCVGDLFNDCSSQSEVNFNCLSDAYLTQFKNCLCDLPYENCPMIFFDRCVPLIPNVG
ncbi:uncharacterized protein LOC116180293 [Photinus pyralis]|uniref:uncharacterized protein LOC116180292 n=1 Tax=Photinus pyralis TaxID=7054 RepID=UPI00126724AB|nr:uncharacterized protein LOC116180292 [Photinus pyralis]XP_031356063.1 uncharacterized protein LOC116180293 [Photinus pyralis]